MDEMVLCLLYVGIFCGTRTSEVMGMQWKSWNGESLMPHGTAFEGKLYAGRLKTKQSKAAILRSAVGSSSPRELATAMRRLVT
jgi:hypothetical protein